MIARGSNTINYPYLDLTIGLSSVTTREAMEEVSISVGLTNGTLKPDNIANIYLQIQSPQGTLYEFI